MRALGARLDAGTAGGTLSAELLRTLAAGDRAWIAGIRAGDPLAFEAMFRTHYRALHAFALRYLNADGEADDVVQDVLCWVWEHRTVWRVHTTLETYLFGAVRNRALNRRKHARVVEEWEAQALRARLVEEPCVGDHADRAVEDDELQLALRRAIEALPARCRQVYTLRWADRLSHQEIAGRMGISVKTVESQLARGLRMLRRTLETFF